MIDGTIRGRTIDACFREIVRQLSHEAIAVETGDASRLTYAQLDQRVDAVATEVARVVGDDRVGERAVLLLATPSLVVTAIHAVLRAGQAFVPLDPGHPPARLATLLAHAEARVVVTERALLDTARGIAGDVPIVVVDDVDARAATATATASQAAPVVVEDAARMACILYTSGSTGAPKGVVHTHASLLHSFMNYANGLGLTSSDRLALTGSPAFAATLSDIFGATLTGATLVAWPLAQRGLGGLAAFMAAQRATVWFMVPSVFRRVAQAMTGADDLAALRLVKLAGEALKPDDVRLFERTFPRHVRLLNSLGQTELNLVSQHFHAHGDPIPGDHVPVGRVAADVAIVISESDKSGVGEIHIVSRWLAAGYWRDDALTAKAFAPASEAGAAAASSAAPPLRVFKTGDLGRLDENDILHHLGRRDFMVKVRGVRVDPGEVEAAIVSAGIAREAVVVARPDRAGEARLVAYVVPDPGAAVLGAARGKLAAHLPMALLPSAFVPLPSWPLNANGKLDRAALPDPQAGSAPALGAAADGVERAPGDALEALVLQALWRTLGRPAMSLDDDFFAVGGDSLAAMSATLRLEQDLGRAVPSAALLVHRTARALARALADDGARGHWKTLVPLQLRGDEPPIFCVHPRPGNVASYVALAALLAPDVPVYGLQARGLDGREAPLATLDAMVEAYVAEVRAVAPRGPWRLVGWCAGGILALEMARRLSPDGRDVELVAVCDARIHARGLGGLRSELGAAIAARGLGRFVRQRLEHARDDVRGAVRTLIGEAPVQAGEMLIGRHMDRLVRDYRPRAWPGRVLVLETSEPPPPARVRGDEWIEAGHREVVRLECRHDRVLAEPMVRRVAVLLRDRLRRT